VSAARRVAERLGGRYSTELGIDLDARGSEVERWFIAATLFGTRIATSVAERTFHMLEGAGLVRIDRARHIPWQDLVALLDGGGYARYDFRTATRLQTLSQIIEERYGGQVAEIGRRHQTYPALRDALDALPGWGPVTVGLFLRELRGVWPGAQPPLDPRAALAARHLGLVGGDDDQSALAQISRLARAAHLDLRDLESGLVRCALAHGTAIDQCPGGTQCTLISRAH
jgi:endonuclease III